MRNILCTGFGFAGSIFTVIFGGWDAAIATFMIFMGIDYITGLMVAGIFHKSGKTPGGALESHAGWKGLCRKGVSLFMVLVAHRLDIAMNSEFIRDAVVIAFTCNETISIIENAGLMGIPVPGALKRAIEVLQIKNGNQEAGKEGNQEEDPGERPDGKNDVKNDGKNDVKNDGKNDMKNDEMNDGKENSDENE